MTPPPAAVPTQTPATIGEASEVLRAARERGAVLAFVGGGTELGFGYPPERVDVVVRTQGLARIVEYKPADMIVTVEAGTTVAALQSELATHGQRLTLDSPLPERATIGGVVATNAFGPRRARYGSIRDLIVGISVVNAEGALVRGGGKVVKNVAGFDVPKLMVGSLGTLGLIATATFRLYPLAESERMLVVRECDASGVRTLARAIVEAQLEPAAVVALREDGGYAMHVLFEGFGAGVEEQAALFASCVTQAGLAARVLDADAVAAYERAHTAARTAGDIRIKATFLPSRFPEIDAEALNPLGAELSGGACAVYPTLGVAFIGGLAGDPQRVAAALVAARTAIERGRGSLTLLEAPDTVRERVDVFGATPPSLLIMRRLKERFDPERRLNRGRFVGHI